MANKVLLKKSSTAAKVPLTSDLDYGELALNYTDGKLYFKNASNVISGFSNNILSDTVASWAITSTFSGVSNPTDIYFKPDGTKMFLSVASTINQYTLSTPWDITTAGSLVSITNTWDTATTGMFFSPDGTKLVTCGQTAVVNAGLSIAASEDRAYYLTLSTAWDISSTVTLVSSLRFAIGDAGLPAAETVPAGITFKSDGMIMYLIGSTGDAIYQYALSTAYNVSTATYSKQLSISSIENAGSSIRFNGDGTRIYIVGTGDDAIIEYRLTTAWDIATAVYYDELYIGYSELSPSGIYIDETSNSAYMVGTTSDLVTKFATNSTGISITPELTNGNGKIILVGDTRIKNGNLYVNKSVQVDGGITLAGSITASGNIVANNITTTSSAITLGGSITTGATTITSTQTTGVINIGGASGTGAITLGLSTAAQTLNLATGATATSTTKTVNIGTAGLSGSTTTINIGSAVAGATTTVGAYGTWTFNTVIGIASGGTGVTSSTGSGSNVLSTSPTLTSPVIGTIVNTGTLTLPTSTDTLVGRATTDTLTNKSLTSPTLTGTPVAPTATAGDVSTQVATTAFADNVALNKAVAMAIALG